MNALVQLESSVLGISMRDKVNHIEKLMLEMPQVEMPPTHYFSPGVYAREITIPAGTTLTGKIHKYPQLNILSKGDMSVLTEEGIKRVQASFTVVSPAGTKRIAYAHTECVWTTIHATLETDIDKLEEHFVVETEEQYLAFCKQIEVERVKCLTS